MMVINETRRVLKKIAPFLTKQRDISGNSSITVAKSAIPPGKNLLPTKGSKTNNLSKQQRNKVANAALSNVKSFVCIGGIKSVLPVSLVLVWKSCKYGESTSLRLLSNVVVLKRKHVTKLFYGLLSPFTGLVKGLTDRT